MIFDRWAPEREAALTFLWRMGLSYIQIGEALGTSRSAVAGKCKRLNLRRQQLLLTGPSGEELVPAVRAPVTPPLRAINVDDRGGGGMMLRIRHRLGTMPNAEMVEWDRSKLPAVDTSKTVSLLESQAWQCKFPVGDDPLAGDFYCGLPAIQGSYCHEHARVCFRQDTSPRIRLPSWRY